MTGFVFFGAARSAPPAAEESAKEAADDRAADAAADRPHGAFGRGFEHAFAPPAARAGAAEKHGADGAADAALRGGGRSGAGQGTRGAGSRSDGGGVGDSGAEFLGGAFAVHRCLVGAEEDGGFNDLLTLGSGDGADFRPRRQDEGALDDAGRAGVIEQGDESFADAELGDGLPDIELRVLAKGLRGALHGFLVARGEGAEGVLHAVAELAEDFLGDVDGVLRDEIDADAFRADEADDLFDFVFESFGDVVEEEVGFVEEEDEFRFVEVAD